MTVHRVSALLAAVLLALPSIAAAVSPEEAYKTAARLENIKLDTSRSFPAEGQVLSRDGIEARFDEGRFFPIVREDDRVVGLVFDGEGEVVFLPPEGIERAGWDHLTDSVSTTMTFGAAHLRFTDGALFELQGDRPWTEARDPSGANFRVFAAREELLKDTRWSRWNPHLLADQLMDLLGGGHVGGHLLAEFRPAGSTNKTWYSSLTNPRGALVVGEPNALYQVRLDGDAPPEVNLLASWGTSESASMPFDVAATDIDIRFLTSRPSDRNLIDAEVEAELDIISLGTGGPLRGLQLELEPERLLCTGTSDLNRIKIFKVKDDQDRVLGTIHRGNRVFIRLAEPVERGKSVKITIGYRGPMTQGLKAEVPDVYFSELGPWAWYPRNLHPDRFASRVTAHMPRFMSAVAPGDLVKEDKGKEGWTFVYEEPSGVANLTLVVGDLIRTANNESGSNPKIFVWYGMGQEKQLKDSVQPTRQLVDFVSALWGPYPYSTLHVVENLSYPRNNWSLSGDSGGGKWSCVPPGQTQPWQGWAERPSGILLTPSPVTAPSKTQVEADAIDDLFTKQVKAAAHNRIVDLTRQWWGHMVPPRSARDLWITEALSAWTGTMFVRAGVGVPDFKARLETQRRLMSDFSRESGPLARGAMLGRQFAPQAWGRGPLALIWLADRVGIKVFLNAFNGLINRASGPGITLDMLADTISNYSDSGVADQLRHFAESNELPTIDYSVSINKDTGEVTVVFQQTQEGFLPVDIPIEFVVNRKERHHRVAFLTSPRTVVQWTFDKAPKRVLVDPVGSAMVRSINKVKELP